MLFNSSRGYGDKKVNDGLIGDIADLSDLKASEHIDIVVAWFKKRYPQFADLIFKIPYQARKIDSVGYQGLPSLLIAVPRVRIVNKVDKLSDGGSFKDVIEGSHGLFIEIKKIPSPSSKMRVHRQQLYTIEQLKKAGYKAYACCGCNESINTIKNYMDKNDE